MTIEIIRDRIDGGSKVIAECLNCLDRNYDEALILYLSMVVSVETTLTALNCALSHDEQHPSHNIRVKVGGGYPRLDRKR